ncbi:MAG: corrinoid protein [Eubacteriales bacterium]
MSIKDMFEAVLAFKADRVVELVKEEFAGGTEISSILNDGLISAMDEVGRRFATGEIFVPEMLRSAKAMKAGLEVLKPYLSSSDAQSTGTVIIGTVKGDLHDIGKNLVAMMLEGAGFEVVDIGFNVETEVFLQAAEEKNADIICLSALLTTTMPAMEAVVAAVREKGLKYKSMVGGAPVTEAFAQEIGADGYAVDAAGAVKIARELVSV